MASGTKLVFTFNVDGGTSTQSFAHADSEVTASNVQTLATALITNNSVFTKKPLSLKEAKLVVTSETVMLPTT